MGKKLAIQGHDTRGNEVIELLKMMGGTNPFSNNGELLGNKENCCYYISKNAPSKYISWNYIGPEEIDKYVIFTLEEFLEKYPFKAGNKVNTVYGGCDGTIKEMKWVDNEVKYRLDFGYLTGEWYSANELQSIKEKENMEDKKIFGTVDNSAETKSCTVSLKGGEAIDNSIDSVQFIQSGKIVAVRFNTQNYENEVELQLDDYEIEIRNGKTYAICKKPKYKYPTTYKECCDVLGVSPYYNLRYYTYEKGFDCFIPNDDKRCPLEDKLNTLGKLLICQNAYWKIYGEEMGLGKSWEPDWNGHEFKYGLKFMGHRIEKTSEMTISHVICFPTAEMRDAFYDNFKHLIEQTKELL